jgi:hypothetical protein
LTSVACVFVVEFIFYEFCFMNMKVFLLLLFDSILYIIYYEVYVIYYI